MSNHLHDLIDVLDKNIPVFPDYLSDEQINHVHENASIASSNAVCFDAGEMTSLDGMKTIGDLVRLPYETCWIETRHNDMAVVGHLMWEVDGAVNAQVWRKLDGKWMYLLGWDIVEGGVRIGHFRPDAEHASMAAIVSVATIFLSALNCVNINRVQHKPSEKLQKARAKRGKKPLFSYWTLEIDLPKSRAAGEDYGGTHAAPRLHLRRGHPRQYAPGKYCWVQPHVVGNKAAGMVHKDYAAKYEHA